MTSTSVAAIMLPTTILLLTLHLAAAEIPSYIKICQRNDPQVDKCIMNSVDELRPKISKGIPELDVPGIEPLSLGQIALARGPQGAKLTAVVNDVKVRGPSNFIIQELKSDLNKNRFDFKLLLPRLDFHGKYKMDIQVLLLRLQGRGNITGTFKEYACNVTMRGHKEKRGEEEFLKFDPFKVKLRVGQSSIFLTNLFDGDPVLGPATNRVINENSQLFLQEISPVLERSLADLFTEMANKITSKFTYKELFP
ncbi:circadian clock-controlled protein daywake-like [Choristoneura fumiferana]